MEDRETRKYTLRQRAARQERTRDRIVEATLALHEELGPRNTTISAIAQRAGVQRLTVYRHFPDDKAVSAACTTRWLELNPPPPPSLWEGEADPYERCRRALAAYYDYYGRTARMWSAAYRDMEAVAALQAPMARFESHLGGVRDCLLEGWKLKPSRLRNMAATLGHCLHFATWRSLDVQGLNGKRMAKLALRWIAAAAQGGSPK